MKDIMVSISCLTYNHAAYIRECLDGFLKQKCNFAFEVLIHDDASNDGTQEIIKEYQEKYPDIIKPYIQVENQFSKGRRGFNAKYNFSRAKGKYFAMCEGDDYWADPLKLQKQVDFMEKHSDVIFSYHGAKILHPNGKFTKFKPPLMLNNYKVDKSHFLQRGGAAFQTATCMYKTDLYNEPLPKYYNASPVGDLALAFLAVDRGEIGYIPDDMTVYRYMHKGSWTKNRSLSEKIKNSNEYKKAIEVFNQETDQRFKKECKRLFKNVNSSIVTSYILSENIFIGLIKIIQNIPNTGIPNTYKNFKILVNKIIS